MSGVEDGTQLVYHQDHGDGRTEDDTWTLYIGRREENDICLRNDTFISRQHAYIKWHDGSWWLKDCDSTNGTFVENPEAFFNDMPVKDEIRLSDSQMFRIGRTWLCIEKID
jgi:pSer/pThr/pTyr-binding forkhead associated (FHA) protein